VAGVYLYPKPYIMRLYVGSIVWTVFGVVMAIVITQLDSQQSGRVGAWIICGAIATAGIVMLAFNFMQSRPIVIRDSYIGAQFPARIVKTIPWEKVEKIERIREPDIDNKKTEAVFLIYENDRVAISFSESIGGFASLLDALNKKIFDHRIPAYIATHNSRFIKILRSKSLKQDRVDKFTV